VNTNIENLGRLVDNISTKMQLLENRINNIRIQGSDGIITSRDAGTYYVGLENNNIGSSSTTPWALSWRMDEANDDNVLWSCNLGAVNGNYGKLQDYLDFASIKKDDEDYVWVYFKIVTTGAYLKDFEILTKKGKKQPDMQRAYSKNAFPSEFRLLIGIVQGDKVLYQLLKNDVRIAPEEVFVEEQLGQKNTYYSWNYLYL